MHITLQYTLVWYLNTYCKKKKMAILKVIEVLAESKTSWEDATQNAVNKVSKSVKNIRSAFVQSQSVTVKDGEVEKFRCNVKITFEVS
jgi:flavin-binding protein dodecin